MVGMQNWIMILISVITSGFTRFASKLHCQASCSSSAQSFSMETMAKVSAPLIKLDGLFIIGSRGPRI